VWPVSYSCRVRVYENPGVSHVDDDEWVIRGGACGDDVIVRGAEVHEAEHPGEWALSAAVGRGLKPEEIVAAVPYIRQRQVRAAQARDLRAQGFDVYSDGRPHANIVLPSAPCEGSDVCWLLRETLTHTFLNPNAC